MKTTLCFALFILLALAVPAEAVETKPPMSVSVADQCKTDPVGSQIVFKVREGIRKSAAMKLDDDDWFFQIAMVCTDPDADDKSVISTFSYAITVRNYFGDLDFLATSGVRVCGGGRVDSCAAALVSEIDAAIMDVRQLQLFYPAKK